MTIFWFLYILAGVLTYVHIYEQGKSRKMGYGIDMTDFPDFQYMAIFASLLWPITLIVAYGRY